MSNLKIYCQSCGFAHAYTMQKPNFCQKCGEALGGDDKKKINASPALELEEETFTNNLSGLEYEHVDFTPNVQTLGSIMEQYAGQGESSASNEKVPKRNNLSPQETLEQLKKEGSAIKPKSST